jgi:DNA replication protein DnaC
MLMTPTIEKLLELELAGMAKAVQEQAAREEEYRQYSFDDRFSLIVDTEYTKQENEHFTQRLKQAQLRHPACWEDIDLVKPRGLDRQLMLQLAKCDWVKKGISITLSGPAGIGKSFVACALGHKACRSGYKVLYYRTPRLFQDLLLARMKGQYTRFLKRISKIDVLIIDDFALAPLNDEQSRDLLEVVDDRIGVRPFIIASQIPSSDWYPIFTNATIADAVLDRVVNGSYKIALEGETRRKPVDE